MSDKLSFDAQLRLFVYRHILRNEKSPTVEEMATSLRASVKKVRGSLSRLSESHAFMQQESGELWRAAPFSCIPTPFLVRVGGKDGWQLHLGCAWYSSHVGQGCTDRSFLRLLQLRYVDGDHGRKAALRGAGYSHRVLLASGTRMWLSPDARCFCSGRNSTSSAGAGSGTGRVAARFRWRRVGSWRSYGTVTGSTAVAAKSAPGSGIGVSRSGTCGRILEVRQVRISDEILPASESVREAHATCLSCPQLLPLPGQPCCCWRPPLERRTSRSASF